MKPRPRSLPAVLLLALAGLCASAAGAPRAGEMEFHALIDGTQARPPNLSNGRGIGRFTLNAAQTELTFDIAFDPWISNERFSHIHVDSAGNNGADAIVFDLPNGNPKQGVMPIEEPLVLQALLDGFLYVNVHTNAFPQGEIAGYLLPGTPAGAESWGRLKALYR